MERSYILTLPITKVRDETFLIFSGELLIHARFLGKILNKVLRTEMKVLIQ